MSEFATYIVNLPKRHDRREQASKELESVGIDDYVVWPAIDGDEAEIDWKQIRPIHGWNKNAAALVLTTAQIIQDAKEKKHNKILIVEDDVEFSSDAKEYLEEFSLIDELSWDMFFFGYQNDRSPLMLTNKIVRLKRAFCCHCYMIHSRVYDDYLFHLKEVDRPIDWITSEVFHPMGRCLATKKSIAFQKPDYSNIQKKHVHNKVTV